MIKFKNILLLIACLLMGVLTFAQAPQTISYQAVVRGGNNKLVCHKQISLKASILRGSENGEMVYEEIHTPTTNENGLIYIEIGAGETEQVFTEIDWAQGPYFLKTEIDPNGGVNYSIVAVNEMLSVPYALYAVKAGNAGGSDMTLGNVLANGNDADSLQIKNLADPTDAQDVATKAYIDEVFTILNEINDSINNIYTRINDSLSLANSQYNDSLNSLSYELEQQRQRADELLIGSGQGFIDERDGNIYRIVTIGRQVWMAENLRYLPSVVGPTSGSASQPYYYVYGYDGNDTTIAKSSPNYLIHGVLYNWLAAVNGGSSSSTNPSDMQGICPQDWHLPSAAEWQQLEDALSGENRGSQLAGNANLWESGELTQAEGFGTSNFTASPSGARYPSIGVDAAYFSGMGSENYFWTATEESATTAYFRSILSSSAELGSGSMQKGYAYSVRCVRDIITYGRVGGHDYYDLGLPSGTKWATINVGANNPEDIGEYFAWGETTPKDEYSEGTYTFTGNPAALMPENDAATANWGGEWRMPTKDEMDELVSTCSWQWTTREGTDGYLVVGPNGNTIFLPAAGYREGLESYVVGSQGYYFSSSIFGGNTDYAMAMHIGTSEHVTGEIDRRYGLSVRPVINVNPNYAQQIDLINRLDSLQNAYNEVSDSLGMYSESLDSLNTAYNELSDSLNNAIENMNDSLQNIMDEQREQLENLQIEAGHGFRDDRDGRYYDLITVGGQVWMADNLRYMPDVVGPESGSATEPRYYVYGYNGTDTASAAGSDNFPDYGVLYNWPAAMAGASSSEANPSGVQGVCPNDWHLPSMVEWDQFINAISGNNKGSQLAGNADLWNDGALEQASEFGTSNFMALPSGMRDVIGAFSGLGDNVSFWAASEDGSGAKRYYINHDGGSVNSASNQKDFGFSVRCVRNDVGGNQYVDLGLSNGILWATKNIGAAKPEDYGNYYAWGETSNKTSYSEANYIYFDSPSVLPPSADAATVNWGDNWRMPTADEFQTLIDSCTWTWTNENGNNGYKVVGPNGNSIFLPAAGHITGSSITNVRTHGDYWSSTSFNNALSRELYFGSTSSILYSISRYDGYSVRPVSGALVYTEAVTDVTDVSAVCGGEVVCGNTVNTCGVCWSTSENPTIADSHTSDGSGSGSFTSNITGLDPNTTYYVRAYATKSNTTIYGTQFTFTTSSGAQNGYQYVDLGLSSGVKWATTNIGATTPEGYGDYYAWGETTTKTSYTSANYTYSDSPAILPPAADAATVNWGDSWRMPTADELQTLIDSCTWTWTTQNGVNGYKVVGPNGNSIFLPAAGHITGSSNTEVGTHGDYWSSTSLNYANSRELYFGSTSFILYSVGRYDGYSVRPVSGALVATAEATNVTDNSATCGGEVVCDGGSAVTARGVCWSTSENPTIADNHTSDGSGTGSFESSLTGLVANTTYYVRAYATNSNGTIYGKQIMFVTPSGTYDGHLYVDLGFRNGVKWATTNIGATSPEGNGDYYAWGETTTKTSYTSENYTYSDSPAILPPAADAATVNWGDSWRMPTADELQTLIDSCTWTWTIQNGVNGYKVVGPNGNYIFLPAVGRMSGSALNYAGTNGYYWSSSLDSETKSFGFFMAANSTLLNSYFRYFGYSVRPVSGALVTTAEAIYITDNSATSGGEVVSDGGSAVTARGICWSTSENPTIADSHTSDGSGTGSFASSLTGLVANTTYYVRAYATNSNGTIYGKQIMFVTPSGTYDGHLYIDLGLRSGVKWATTNIGATSPEGYGDYYAWGETTTKTSYTSANYTYSDSPAILPSSADAAIVNWGDSWRMPTKEDFQELVDSCTWTWTTQNGVNGYKVVGPNGNSIFLPAAGSIANTSPSHVDANGEYWSSSSDSGTNNSFELYMSATSARLYSSSRYYGYSVRPVSGMCITATIVDITSVTASITGEIISDGGSPVTARGVCWSTTENPTIADNHTSDGSGIGIFTSTITGLVENTTYYVRAYATNSDGTKYSEQKYFSPNGVQGGYQYVDLGLPSGIKWANVNIGASNPEDYGNYYAWGETTTKTSYSEENYTYSDRPLILPSSADAATVNWGDIWRMPTQAEIQELVVNCTWTWTTLNGMNGYRVTGTNGNFIFLPAAGYRKVTGLNDSGSYGHYWSSMFTNGTTSTELVLLSNNRTTSWSDSYEGLSVRPVCGGVAIATAQAINILENSASSGGELVSVAGITVTARGICWSTAENPTIADSHTSDGSGTGSFSSNITGLAGNTTYYVRAYATTSNGTFYGQQMKFTTPSGVQGEHQYVDLGLPSGLKWASLNLGATNLGDYGDLYAWGETSPKTSYTTTNYTYSDNPSILPSTADAATVNWGEGWRMPTEAEVQELIYYCNSTTGSINGVCCRIFTGPNGNFIYIPSGGSSSYSTMFYGYCWTSSLSTDDESKAYYHYFEGGVTTTSRHNELVKGNRYLGMNIRPVSGILIYTSEVEDVAFSTATCGGEIISEGGSAVTARGVCWSTSENPTISDDHTSDGSGLGSFISNITGLEPNTTYYVRAYATSANGTVYGAQKTFVTKGIENGHEYVDLGLPSGARWATTNIGATNPEDAGNYYSWGETSPKSDYSWDTYVYGNEDSFNKYNATDGKVVLESSDDAAAINWEGNWRMPTKEEFAELKNACTWTWTTENGMNGYRVVGPNGNCIFLPAAGQTESGVADLGTSGHYWTNSIYPTEISKGRVFSFDMSGYDNLYESRYLGYTIRPVITIYTSKRSKK